MFLLSPDIFFWDLAILLLLATGVSMMIGSWVWLKRRSMAAGIFGKMFVALFGLAGLLSVLTVLYGSFAEPRIITVNTSHVTHPLAHTMRIVVLSDLHVGPYKGEAFVQRAVDAVNATLPDMVLLPGDFFFGKHPDLTALEPLKTLHAPLGVYAVLGNHDVGKFASPFGKRYSKENHGEETAKALALYGVRVLRNDHEIIPVPDGIVAVAGIDDLWTDNADVSKALSGIPEGAYAILIAHNPSVIDDPTTLSAHLIVSGHTHGGQLRIPGIGALAHLPISIGQEFDEGLFPLEKNRTLAITRGIGESGPRTRLFAWPEVMVLEAGDI